MKKLSGLLLAIALLVGIPALAQDSRTSGATTVEYSRESAVSATVPSIKKITFLSPSIGTVLNTSQTVSVLWDYEGENISDTNLLTANLALTYYDTNVGIYKNVSVKSVYLNSKKFELTIPASAPVSYNYYICLYPFYSGKSLGGDFCVPIKVKKTISESVEGTINVVNTINQIDQDTTNDYLGLNLKLLSPKSNSALYIGDPVFLQWSYNKKFINQSDSLHLKIYRKEKGWFGFTSNKLVDEHTLAINPDFMKYQITPNLVPGEYLLELSHNKNYDTATIQVVPKLTGETNREVNVNVLNKLSDDIGVVSETMISDKKTAPNKEKIKAAINHLEQAIKLLKDALAE